MIPPNSYSVLYCRKGYASATIWKVQVLDMRERVPSSPTDPEVLSVDLVALYPLMATKCTHV
jgi:hypothetical protein